MDLARKFQEADSCNSVTTIHLQVDCKYPITRAQRVGTRYGPTIILSIRDSPTRILKVFMSKRYYSSFSDKDIEDINFEKVSLYLIFKGKCVNTNKNEFWGNQKRLL